jgi:hypothetical protein
MMNAYCQIYKVGGILSFCRRDVGLEVLLCRLGLLLRVSMIIRHRQNVVPFLAHGITSPKHQRREIGQYRAIVKVKESSRSIFEINFGDAWVLGICEERELDGQEEAK